MPDTIIGSFPDAECADCGKTGCRMFHNGPLVPKGGRGYFCADCADLRKRDYEAGNEPKPIGYRKEKQTAPDAAEDHLPSGECDDCGEKGNFEFHGSLGHASVSGHFCPECKRDRVHANMAGFDPEPIGYKKKKGD